jgi:5-methylcytosine-specific restriction endonuclease McrA
MKTPRHKLAGVSSGLARKDKTCGDRSRITRRMTWLWPIVAVAALAWLVVHHIAFRCLRSIHPSQEQGRTVTAPEVRLMFRNQSGLCNNPYCRADLKRTRFEVDHIVPKSRGGPDGVGNAQLLYRTCNQLKGAQARSVFLVRYQERRERRVASRI